MTQHENPKVAQGNSTPTVPSIVPNISTIRLNVIIFGLWLCLFVSAMDTTIITTALIKISSELHALDQATWLVTAYLLTYNSFLMMTAKLSDVFGLKMVLLACNFFFLAWSMACGGAQSMTQLTVFRAFQGIGGSGLYSLVFVAVVKLIVPEKFAFYSGVVSSVFALANVLGPVLGGLITSRTTWRWIFWINGPVVGISLVIIFFAMPGLKDGKSNRDRLRGFDGIGAFLSVSWPIPLLFAIQEAGVHYEWSSGVIIGTLITGIILIFAFGIYEAWVAFKSDKSAVFPIQFITNLPMALLLLSMFLFGMPFYVAIIQLPQRFQAVNFTSAERAGVLLLPVTLMTPTGAMITGVVAKKYPVEYMFTAATAMVCVGLGLLSSLPIHSTFSDATYGYEIITGLGLGLASPSYFMLMYTSIPEKDTAVGTGALNMMRALGGCVAVAICSALHHSVLQDKLPTFMSPEQIMAVEDTSALISQLPPETRNRLGRVYGQSYNRQFQVMLAMAGLNFLVSLVIIVVRKKKGIFGMLPVRKEENEIMKAAVHEQNADENKGTQTTEKPAGDALNESPEVS